MTGLRPENFPHCHRPRQRRQASGLRAPRQGGLLDTLTVDLLRLLDLDSSLDARKELADELRVHAGEPGTAEQNIALHKAVIAKLAENGGIVPDSLRG